MPIITYTYVHKMFYEGIHWFGNISPNPVDPLIKANFMLS